MSDLKKTPLFEFHQQHQAKMVPFAGYLMPVQYPAGIKAEHLHTRNAAGLFDVSHMGQILVEADNAGELLESLIPSNYVDLAVGKQRYGLLMNDEGGVRDDLMAVRLSDNKFLLVVNAACKDQDYAYLQQRLGSAVSWFSCRALIALQGPMAQKVLAEVYPSISDQLEAMFFMDACVTEVAGVEVIITRSGYTGEDGFEISLPEDKTVLIAESLLKHSSCELIGLGARDSLRMEAGLCLYGHELSESITPIEANLLWAISPKRRPGGEREAGYPGAATIAQQIAAKPDRLRVGVKPLGRAPVREGTQLFDVNENLIGEVCSGGFGPSLNAPLAIAFVDSEVAKTGQSLFAEVRGKKLAVEVCDMPFVANNYRRG